MSEPQKILVAIPTLDCRLDVRVLGGLLQVMATFGPAVRPYFVSGDSNIRHCRNSIAHYFMQSDCDTLVCIDSDIVFTLQDFAYLCEQRGDEQAVVAPYARKMVGRSHVDFGFGFVRLHRSVFERLAGWTDAEGAEMLHRYFFEGALAVDYFFDGATADSRWFSEDTGFWHWCNLAGVKVRKEPRTTLGHIGTFVYGYPDQTPGLLPMENGAQ